MKCLCCGKELINSTQQELLWQWHSKCIKSFFKTDSLPFLDINDSILEELALKNSQLGFTVPGVQKKLSLHLVSDNSTRLTLVGYPAGYILKPPSKEYPFLPENEYLIMTMAKIIGIKTVPFALIKMANNRLAYITKRIDRQDDIKYAMEDFCQLSLRLTADKYKGSYERCAKIIERYSNQKIADLTEFYIRIIFSFLVNNSDMHLKNFSLISLDGVSYHLSAAYDMLAVNLAINDKDEMALTLNGKNRHLRRKDFLILGENIGLKKNVCVKLINWLVFQVPNFINMCNDSYLSNDLKEKFINLIQERSQILKE